MTAPTLDELIHCPFCGEDEFDLIGLKLHLLHTCDDFNNTPDKDPPAGEREAKAAT